ncbi:hypothetical protein ACN47E_005743 [Coniothyrium glycines]
MPSSKISVSSAKASKNAEPEPEKQPVYFWRPHETDGYLGQWYVSKFTVDGESYATAEMWMMVSKARLFNDEAIAKQMFATTDPKAHKALGQKVKNFDAATWDEKKLDIVIKGNYHKFTASEDAAILRKRLLETGDRLLVEASPRDRIWGVGFGEKNAWQNKHRWGQNLLGKALMSVRDRLREEDK